MIIYVVYIRYSDSWVFALSVDILTILIMFQNLVLNSELVNQPKSNFVHILNVFKIKIVLNYKKSHVL